MEFSLLAHATFDLDFAIEEDDVLAMRSWMPCEVVIGRRFPKDNRRDRVRLGKTPDGTCIVEIDLKVFESRCAVVHAGNAGYFHGRSRNKNLFFLSFTFPDEPISLDRVEEIMGLDLRWREGAVFDSRRQTAQNFRAFLEA